MPCLLLAAVTALALNSATHPQAAVAQQEACDAVPDAPGSASAMVQKSAPKPQGPKLTKPSPKALQSESEALHKAAREESSSAQRPMQHMSRQNAMSAGQTSTLAEEKEKWGFFDSIVGEESGDSGVQEDTTAASASNERRSNKQQKRATAAHRAEARGTIGENREEEDVDQAGATNTVDGDDQVDNVLSDVDENDGVRGSSGEKKKACGKTKKRHPIKKTKAAADKGEVVGSRDKAEEVDEHGDDDVAETDEATEEQEQTRDEEVEDVQKYDDKELEKEEEEEKVQEEEDEEEEEQEKDEEYEEKNGKEQSEEKKEEEFTKGERQYAKNKKKSASKTAAARK